MRHGRSDEMLPERTLGWLPESSVRLDKWGPVIAPIGFSRSPPEDWPWSGRKSRRVPSALTAGFGCNWSGAGPWIRRFRV